jgi:5'-nucleotidase
LLYDGTGADARVVGVEWNVTAASAPAGFSGSSDVWTDQGDGTWRLRAWILRPFENQPNLFATTHPCLGASAAVYDVSAPCFTSTHTTPLEVLVVNDDGYSAPGIDAVVEGLRTLPGVHIDVVAPATNQSGGGDRTTPGGVTGFAAQTQSGYPATAVNGFPADSVLYALNTMHLNPDLVVSGINEGQNLALVVGVSGTVGAARTAARNHVQAVAASQGTPAPADFPSGRKAVLTWVNDFRLGRVGTNEANVDNINIPTCTAGAIRGTVRTTVATAWNGRAYGPSDCTSTSTAINDDLDAFLLGYVGIADVGR